MSENIFEIPQVVSLNAIVTDKVQSVLALHQPQIVQHLAFIPIRTENINEQLLDTIGLIEEFKLEQDIIVKEGGSGYDSAVFENKTDKNIIVPAATHMKGGSQNRGTNFTEVLGQNESERYSVNCFEQTRGSGDSEHFTEFDDIPADVARDTMTNTDGYEGSWDVIRDYTKLAGIHDDKALSAFNKKTDEERAKYALNFEPVVDQTGAAIITKGLSMIEVFPTPTTFNIYSQRLLKGKIASLYYKLHNSGQTTLILPSEVSGKVNEMLNIVKKGIEDTCANGTKKNGLIIGRGRQGKQAIDIILTDTDPPQIAYVFGAW